MSVQKEIDDQIFKTTLKILSDLIKFQTESGKSNLKLIEYCEKELKKSNAYSFKTFNNSKTQANLFSTIGGSTQVKDGGIILSGHTDVVPAPPKDWTSDPFIAREENNKIYGRGTSDMKGFIACTLADSTIVCIKKIKITYSFFIHI